MLGTKCPKCGGKNWAVKTNFGYHGEMTETYDCMTCTRIPWRLPPERLSDYPGRIYGQNITNLPKAVSDAYKQSLVAAIAPIRTEPPKVVIPDPEPEQPKPPAPTICKTPLCNCEVVNFESLEFFPYCSWACKDWGDQWFGYLSAPKGA